MYCKKLYSQDFINKTESMSVCRVCLCSKPGKDIRELKHDDDRKQNYRDIMEFCLAIQIAEDSTITTKLCTKCYKKIIEFYQFKLLALKSDAHLRCLISENVKYENYLEDNLHVPEDYFIAATLTDIDLQGIGEKDEIIIKEENYFDQIEDDLCSNDNEELPFDVEVKVECSKKIPPDDTPVSVSSVTNENVEELENELISTKKVHSERYTLKRRKYKKKYRENNTSKICPQCGKLVKDLKLHLVTHSSYEQRRKFKCELCPKIFQTIQGRYRHALTHSNNAKKQCSICNIEVLHLKAHMKNVHEPEARRFHCVICDKKYVSQAMLDEHVSVHINDKNFQCDECGHSFRTTRQLDKHKRRIHLKEKGFQCDYCSRCFFIKERLVQHMRVHTKEKPYPCPDCEMKFISSTSLRKHRYIHSGLKFDCTKCDMTFINPIYLKTHLKTHMKIKGHPCRYCEVAFYRSDHRNRHERTAHLKPKAESAATKTKAS